MEAILENSPSGADMVETFMKYFNKTYLNHVHLTPKRWLHIGYKENIYYDATNNLQESLNHVHKMTEDMVSSLSFTSACKKMKEALERNLFEFNHLEINHDYKYSYDKSFSLKEKRVETIIEKIELHNKSYKGLQKYRGKI